MPAYSIPPFYLIFTVLAENYVKFNFLNIVIFVSLDGGISEFSFIWVPGINFSSLVFLSSISNCWFYSAFLSINSRISAPSPSFSSSPKTWFAFYIGTDSPVSYDLIKIVISAYSISPGPPYPTPVHIVLSKLLAS